MSISQSDLSLMVHLSTVSIQINRYVNAVLLLLGLVGNSLSCLIFLQRVLRSNPCALYFLAASVSNMLFLSTLLSPMLDAWNEQFNLINTSSLLCKLIMFVILMSRTLSLWFITLATIDRYIVSSSDANRRKARNTRTAYYCLLLAGLTSALIWAESIYCFDANLIGTPVQCYTSSHTCQLYNDICLALVTVTIPSVLMLIFGFLTIVNIRQSKQSVVPSASGPAAPDGRSRKTENTLTRMLLTQVFLVVLLNLPQAIHIFYLTITFSRAKTPLQRAIDGFIFNMLLLLPFVCSCLSFFLYTLSGSIFRQTLAELLHRVFRRLRPQ